MTPVERAEALLKHYAALTGLERPTECELSQVITDLRYYADDQKIDFAREIRESQDQYKEETVRSA